MGSSSDYSVPRDTESDCNKADANAVEIHVLSLGECEFDAHLSFIVLRESR